MHCFWNSLRNSVQCRSLDIAGTAKSYQSCFPLKAYIEMSKLFYRIVKKLTFAPGPPAFLILPPGCLRVFGVQCLRGTQKGVWLGLPRSPSTYAPQDEAAAPRMATWGCRVSVRRCLPCAGAAEEFWPPSEEEWKAFFSDVLVMPRHCLSSISQNSEHQLPFFIKTFKRHQDACLQHFKIRS